MLKIRRSRDRLIFNIGIPILGKEGLYIETGPRRWLGAEHATRHYQKSLRMTNFVVARMHWRTAMRNLETLKFVKTILWPLC